ncbi:hypothetical protein AB2B41_03420 [Marimonas sp. MJW-29]|uniref:Uncharacterized protein n=1 Tax=Sulfitobacter sediminis TaxID=3234186 RepID=A0ABV3RJS0_9RHOB
MFRLIYRQRRRLLFGTFFVTMALILMALDFGGAEIIGPYPTWIMLTAVGLTSLLVALGVLLTGILIILLMPNWRSMIELFALIFFVNAVLGILAPSVYDIPYFGGFMPLFLTIAIFSLVYGEALDRFRLWVDYDATRSFVSPKAPEELWAELVPCEAPVEGHWDSLLYRLEPDPEDADTLQAQYTHGGSCYEHQTMTFLEKEAPHIARYHHVGEVDPKNRSLVEGIYEVRITPREGGGSTVTFLTRRNLMLHRQALAMWFDDHLGDQADHLRARHMGRADWSQTGRYRRKVGQFA